MTEADFMKLKNIVRIGTVSSVDVESRTARVTFTDKGGAEPLVSGPLQVVQNHTAAWIPAAGQMVVCLFLPNADGDGFVIGGI